MPVRILGGVGMTGEPDDAAGPERPVPYRELFLRGHLTEPTLAVVRSEAGFHRLWAAAHAQIGDLRHPGRPAVPPPPAVAWDRETVLVAALGQRPTITGYAVYLSLRQNRYGVRVLVHEALLDPAGDHPQAVGYPTILAATAIGDADVAFHLQQPVTDYEPTPEQRAVRQQAYDAWRLSEERRRA